jgi:hypothetical protein
MNFFVKLTSDVRRPKCPSPAMLVSTSFSHMDLTIKPVLVYWRNVDTTTKMGASTPAQGGTGLPLAGVSLFGPEIPDGGDWWKYKPLKIAVPKQSQSDLGFGSPT